MNKKVKILIIGFGSIGRRHFNNLVKLGYNNISFLRSKKSNIETSGLVDYKVYFNHVEAFKENPEIVFITNPTSLHMDMAIKAAKNASHIFIEKPISNSLDSYDELRKLVNEKKIITMVGFQFRFNPILIKLKKMLKNKELGEVFHINSFYGEYLPNWHPWEDYKLSYTSNESLGGGVILTLSHPIDYLIWMFGSVDYIQSSFSKSNIIETNIEDDLANITMHFNSGEIANVHLNYVSRPPKHSLDVYGEKKSVHIDFLKNSMVCISNEGKVLMEYIESSFNRNDMYLDEVSHFMSSIESNEKTILPLEVGKKSLKICLSALERENN